RLVEPLLGGVYAGDAYRISMRAAVPQLYAAARRKRSLIEAVRSLQQGTKAGPPSSPSGRFGGPGPVFTGIRGGVGRLPQAVAEACRAAGAQIETGTAVRCLRRAGRAGWQLVVHGPQGRRVVDADAVVLAV